MTIVDGSSLTLCQLIEVGRERHKEAHNGQIKSIKNQELFIDVCTETMESGVIHGELGLMFSTILGQLQCLRQENGFKKF